MRHLPVYNGCVRLIYGSWECACWVRSKGHAVGYLDHGLQQHWARHKPWLSAILHGWHSPECGLGSSAVASGPQSQQADPQGVLCTAS